MKWSFDIPLIIEMGPKPLTVLKVKHGVTEASLSDGRLVCLTLHVDGVKVNDGDNLDITYTVATEILDAPKGLIQEVHETVQ